MDFSHHLFRCSSLGHLLTDTKSAEDKKAGNLSEGAKTHLADVYASVKYGRYEEVNNKFIEKGLTCEEDSITLYSRVTKNFYLKNDTRLKNLFIQGEPDLYKGKAIYDADEVSDIKTSWSLYTFLRTFTKKTNQLYFWQGQGYLWLTGALLFKLAYCLVNAPESLIEAEIKRLWFKMGQPDETSDLFRKAQDQIIKNMTYDDIPLAERVLEYKFERDQDKIDAIQNKVVKGREFLAQLHIDLQAKQIF